MKHEFNIAHEQRYETVSCQLVNFIQYAKTTKFLASSTEHNANVFSV